MNCKHLLLAIVLVLMGSAILAAQGGQTAADKNKQIEAQNAAMQKAANDGAAAFTKKDYAAAIDIYQKAYAADPLHPNSPTLLKNIAAVKLQRAVETFNAGAKTGDDAAMTASKKDMLDAELTIASALGLAKTNNYAPDKIAPIAGVQKEVFQQICKAFFFIGSLNSDNAALQKSADAAKAFLALATTNDPNRTEASQILAELKSSYNIVPK